MLKDRHPRLPSFPPPHQQAWGQPRRELTSAPWTLASQPGVSSRGAEQLGVGGGGKGHSHSESVGFWSSLRNLRF